MLYVLENGTRVRKVDDGSEVAYLSHEQHLTDAAFSSDGKYLVTASGNFSDEGIELRDNTVRVWEMPAGKEVASMPFDDGVNDVGFSPDGRHIAAASDDRTAAVWATTTGREVARMTHDDTVAAVAFSPDGKHLATGSADRTARVREVATGREVSRMSNEEESVDTVAFSPDGEYLAMGSADRTARVREVATGREVSRMEHPEGVFAVAFTAGGKFLTTASTDRGIRVWLWRPGDLIGEACDRLGRNLTEDEWELYLPDEPYRKTCPNLPGPRG